MANAIKVLRPLLHRALFCCGAALPRDAVIAKCPIIGSVRFSAPSLHVRTWGLFVVLFVLFLVMRARRSHDKAAIKICEKQENMQ